MPLLIDCYNVLHQPMPPSLAGLDEGGLCLALARSRWVRTPAKIICDGMVKPSMASASPVEGIDLIYSGRGISADSLIIELIETDSAPRRLLVVSSDREIQKVAGRRRAKVMSSEEFVRELAATAAYSRNNPDLSGRPDPSRLLSPPEVKRWLERFGIEEEPDDDGKKRRSR